MVGWEKFTLKADRQVQSIGKSRCAVVCCCVLCVAVCLPARNQRTIIYFTTEMSCVNYVSFTMIVAVIFLAF